MKIPKWKDLPEDRVAAMRAEGKSRAEIARLLGVSLRSVEMLCSIKKINAPTWDRARASELLKQGRTRTEIAEMVGASYSSVVTYLAKQDVPPAPSTGRPARVITREELAPLVEQGLSQNEITARLKTSWRAVQQGLVKYGLKITYKQPTRIEQFSPEAIRAEIAKGLGITALVKLTGSHYCTLVDYLKRHGIERPRSQSGRRPPKSPAPAPVSAPVSAPHGLDPASSAPAPVGTPAPHGLDPCANYTVTAFPMGVFA